MKKLMVLTVAALAATALMAAPTTTRKKGTKSAAAATKSVMDEDDNEAQKDPRDRILVDIPPRLGRQTMFAAPSVSGAAVVSGVYTRPRQWIVLEMKYTTFAEFCDQLVFTWHVLLSTKSSTLNRGNSDVSPYSYFTTSVTYQNIPDGSHAASVVLPPSYLERYGQPCTVGYTISDARGNVLVLGCESVGTEVQGFAHPKSLEKAFWNDPKIMNAKNKDGNPMIEPRQGLKDRSKTIWAMVNPNDYEDVAQ